MPYLSSGPIVVMILEGQNAVLANRELMGARLKTQKKIQSEIYLEFQ